MTLRMPPTAAAWLLKRLGPAYQCESLAGDLLEEYQRGRSHAWYWRQALAAVVINVISMARVRLPKFVLTTVLRILIELGVIFGGIALADSKAVCPATLRACHADMATLSSPTHSDGQQP